MGEVQKMSMAGSDKALVAEQIATATRLLVMEDILDYSGHISARLDENRVLIQNASDSRAELDPGRLLIVDMDGNVIEGDAKPPYEVVLHTEILKARPDVNAVLHCHMEMAVAFTLMKGVELKPMRSRASRWASGIPTHPDPSLIRSPEQGKALAKTLGPHHAALIRSHGMILTAESVPAMFIDAIHFKENAAALMTVLQAGQEPVPMTPEEIASITGSREFHIAKLWNYFVSLGRKRDVLPRDWDVTL